jgi:hypothetical protein
MRHLTVELRLPSLTATPAETQRVGARPAGRRRSHHFSVKQEEVYSVYPNGTQK